MGAPDFYSKIALILQAYNKVRLREISGDAPVISVQAAIEEDPDTTFDVKDSQYGQYAYQDPNDRFRARIEQRSKVVKDKQAELFVRQIAEDIVNNTGINEETAIDYVASNLFQGADWDESKYVFTPPTELTPFGNASWENYANRTINSWYNRLDRDSSIFLKEHELEAALVQVVEKDRFGPDSELIAHLILGGDKMDSLGYTIDTSDPQYQSSKQRILPQMPNILSRFNNGMIDLREEFSSGSGKSDFGRIIESQIDDDTYVLFGTLAEPVDTTGINYRQFREDPSYREKIVGGWIKEFGGDPNPNDQTFPDDWVERAHHTANRKIFGSNKEQGEFNSFLNTMFDKKGVVNTDTELAATAVGLDNTDQYIVENAKSFLKSRFFTADDEGLTRYQRDVQTNAEDYRLDTFRKSPSKANTALKSMLMLDKNLWVEDENGELVPVTDKRVSDGTWADWMSMYVQSGEAATKRYIVPQIAGAVAREQSKDFDRSDAESQAKDFFARNGVKWNDIPLQQQQAIISSVESRGGLDVDRAVSPPLQDSSEIIADLEEGGVPGGYSNTSMGIDPEYMYGEELLEYGSGIIRRRAEAELFDETASNPLNLIYDVLKEKNILNPGVSTGFLDNIDRNVAPLIARRVLTGQYSSIDEIRQEVESQIEALPAYEIRSADYDRQIGATPPTFAGLPGFRAMPATPEFDVNAFAPELQEIAFDRPELAGFVQQQMMVPGFEKEWQQAAQRQLRHDREADKQLQDERLESFEAARAKSIFAKGEPTDTGFIGKTREQVVEDAEDFLAQVQASDTATEADIIAAESQVREAQSALASGAGAYQKAQAAVTRAEEQYAREVPSPAGTVAGPDWKQQRLASVAQPGFMPEYGISATPAQQQFLSGMAKMMTTPGMTQQQFFESKLPGFQQRFEASPFFRLEQERLEQEKVTQQRRTEAEERAEERAAESKRRSRLRGGSALAVFGRRQ
tara:strand:- start:12305 stop:15217 length:2913 start_codon:yes stop_codon:yes gene_type:complete